MNKPLILWGGTDIGSEFFYNTPRSMYSQLPDIVRDIKEKNYVELAISKGQHVVGVCRGAQLLCAINGGSLYQHSKPTNQSHHIETTGGMFHNVAAGHHQIMRPSGNYDILGWNPEPTLVWVNDELAVMVSNTAEVVWWPDTKCLAIQPHPEWEELNAPFNHWINGVMKQYGIDYAF